MQIILSPLTLLACVALGIALGKRRPADPLEHGFDTIVMRIDLGRVFVFRIWLGRALMKLSLWVIGGRAIVLEFPD